MKLRNKKTGEIVKVVGYVKTGDDRMFFRFEDDNGIYKKEYNSLSEVNAEWEDVPEEPKEYWYIDIDGEIMFDNVEDDTVKVMREIGNYFSSREEAEQAVEKLKAWKRLKDNGFRFYGWNRRYCDEINFQLDVTEDLSKDLDLLFSGEDD